MKWVQGFCPERVFGGAGGGTPCPDKCDAGSLPKEGLFRWKRQSRNFPQTSPAVASFAALGLRIQREEFSRHRGCTALTAALPCVRERYFTASVFPATKPNNPGAATDSAICFQYRRRSKSVPCYSSAVAMGQLLCWEKPRRPNCFCPLVTPATRFRQVTASRMRSAFPR